MVSERAYNLTHSDKTLTSVPAENPKESPGDLGKKLYEEHHHGTHNPTASGGIASTVKSMLKCGSTSEEAKAATAEDEPSKEDLDRAAECGRFGTRPSDLFLKVCLASHLYASRQDIGTTHDAISANPRDDACPSLHPPSAYMLVASICTGILVPRRSGSQTEARIHDATPSFIFRIQSEPGSWLSFGSFASGAWIAYTEPIELRMHAFELFSSVANLRI